MTKPIYKVTAKRWSGGWELHIDGVGVTQSHTLDDAGIMARDYIAMDLDVQSDSFDVHIVPELGGQSLEAEAAEELSAVERIIAKRNSLKARLVRLSEITRSGGSHSHGRTHSRTRSGR